MMQITFFFAFFKVSDRIAEAVDYAFLNPNWGFSNLFISKNAELKSIWNISAFCTQK